MKTNKPKLINLVPHGLVVTRKWLLAQGLGKHSIDNAVKSGQLNALAYGVYERPGNYLKWEGVITSLQRMGYSAVAGGLTALGLQGYAHYLPLGNREYVHVYSGCALPAWINKLLRHDTNVDVEFVWHNTTRLFKDTNTVSKIGDREINWADNPLPLLISTPEKAFLEVLFEVPQNVSFEHADQLLQGLVTLSPRRLHALLLNCQHIKTKRLFFWFLQRHEHAWINKLNPDDYDLGAGKRMIVKGGKLDRRYQITVPESMLHG